MDYDIAIIGLGPAGATLARLLNPGLRILALDKKQQSGNQGFQKPCGGLLASDAQRAFVRFGINLPTSVLACPQIFSVKTYDLQSGLTCNYQRTYVNIDRHRFDLWLKTLIPANVDVRHDSLCRKIILQDDGCYRIQFTDAGDRHQATVRYVVGADGANSMVRRMLYPQHKIRKYLCIQQWFIDKHRVPFYSCIFDNTLTDCYSWSMSKDGYFIIGGAFPVKNANAKFETLKTQLLPYSFIFGDAVKTEKCIVLCPSKMSDFRCGKDNIFLIGEAAGFISPSSLEGISYAFNSAEILSKIINATVSNTALFNKKTDNPNNTYYKKTLKLRLKLCSKIVKAAILTHPFLRRLIMKSKICHINTTSSK